MAAKKLTKRLTKEQLAAKKAKEVAVTKNPSPNSYIEYLKNRKPTT